MGCLARFRAVWILGSLAALGQHPALGLVRLNDGTDQIFVSGTYTISHASNIDASADGVGDTISTYAAGLEYQRRAGLIGVNASASFTLNDYFKYKSYDSLNPSYRLEFEKDSGRETGALAFAAARTSQTDVAANVHDVSWDYTAELKVKYPVIDRYFLTGSIDGGYLDYIDTGGQPLIDLKTYGASAGLFYVLSDQRDLFASYRIRQEDSSDHTSTTDDALSIGVDGQVIGPIQGSLSAGYQLRYPHGIPLNGPASQGRYGDWTAEGQLSWAPNPALTFAANLSKDFATTSTNATTDTTGASLNATYVRSKHLSFTSGLGGGLVAFYGPYGLLPDSATERRDRYASWNAGITYQLNSHLQAGVAYNYFRNASNLAFATFPSRSYSATLTSHW
ncbi:MAG: outer membrane beta-barrel protein [Opitutaceae bacterium]